MEELRMRQSTLVPPQNRKTFSMGKLRLAEMACLAALVCLPLHALYAQTFTVLASFDGVNGELPQSSLVQGVNGSFYGTTPMGGTSTDGTVFEVTPAGQLKTLYSFCTLPNCADGWQPEQGLVLGLNGNLYGTTAAGGKILGSCLGPGCGTIFEITPAGKLTVLHSFCSLPHCVDGAVPVAGLVLGSDGNFYGAASKGGQFLRGTVFKITPEGKFTLLYGFCSQKNCPDGSYPITNLIQAPNGNFYGSTYDGGAVVCPFFQNTFGCGTIFEITPAGQLTTLYNFGTVAGLLQSPLAQAANGNFYGTSLNGGTGKCGYGCGTVFEITPAGELTTPYSFCTEGTISCPDGAYPMAGLVLATDGNFYGTTSTGGEGAGETGTVFAITPDGALHTVHNFGGISTGQMPQGTLLQATDGRFYGVTHGGGASNIGTVFQLSVGLARFVQSVPTAGTVGAKVLILGNGLTGTTSVTFNGTPATFTVSRNTAIRTTVPVGATTGTLEVTTPSGTLKSNVVFQVNP
jgi:uncharacterized repeat protein (TIGR03803 family)